MGLRHQVTREEVLYMLTGRLRAELGGEAHDLGPGDVLVVPAGSTFAADNPASAPATAWVTTSAGFRAVLPDGTWFQPPWTH
jgi:mannose-6-phosphate isomerase-like protein (cupin superfamily)